MTARSALADALNNAVAAGADILAADVLAAGECTATCLLAREPDGCACRCGGTWHGTLSGVQVTANAGGGERSPVHPGINARGRGR
jgi:hypothetical protein